MSESGDWISASNALDLVEAQLGGRGPAKDTLAEMLRDEKIRARASEAWACDTSDINAIWEGDSQNNVEHDPNEEVQSDFGQSIQWADDIDSWRWPDSFFMITVSRRPKECLYYRDVTFFRDDLVKVSVLDRSAARTESKGGRRPDLHRWESFWMEVVQIARDGNLVPGQIRSQAALREDLLAAMKGVPLSEDSIKEPVRRIWQRFCED
jgi:hypothetical protein